jgi:adenylate kinase
MDKRHKNISAKVLKNISAETLASFVRTMNPFGSISLEAAKALEAFTEAEKREQKHLQQVLPIRIAKAADEAAKANPEHRALINSVYKEFKGCFGYVNGDPLVLSMLDAAMFILSMAPTDEETREKLAKEATRKFTQKGGKARSKQKKYEEWKRWRQPALKRAKKVLREELEEMKKAPRKKQKITQSSVADKVWDALPPGCCNASSTLQSAISKWARRYNRLLPIIQKRKSTQPSKLEYPL